MEGAKGKSVEVDMGVCCITLKLYFYYFYISYIVLLQFTTFENIIILPKQTN